MEIDISAEISAATDKLGGKLDTIHKGQGRRWFPRSVSQPFSIPGALGNYVVNLGAPARGKLWNPVSFATVGVPSASFVLTGPLRIAFCIGDSANPTPSQIVQYFEGNNNASYGGVFGTEALWAGATEDCYAWITTAIAQAVVVNMRMREYEQDTIEPRFA